MICIDWSMAGFINVIEKEGTFSNIFWARFSWVNTNFPVNDKKPENYHLVEAPLFQILLLHFFITSFP